MRDTLTIQSFTANIGQRHDDPQYAWQQRKLCSEKSYFHLFCNLARNKITKCRKSENSQNGSASYVILTYTNFFGCMTVGCVTVGPFQRKYIVSWQIGWPGRLGEKLSPNGLRGGVGVGGGCHAPDPNPALRAGIKRLFNPFP